MEVVILIGLQGSGKTTFCQRRFAATHAHVSRDRLRNNRRPRRREQELIRTALGEGKSLVVDNTHPSAADRAPIIAQAREFGARVVGYFFEPDLEACLARNRQREGKACVPEIALYATLKALERPSWAEGFDELHGVRMTDNGGFEISKWNEELTTASSMKPETLDARMRALEYFHHLRLLPGAWAVVRVDGRAFSRLTAEHFQKPFDPRFHEHMLAASEALLAEFEGLYAYTESDEISLLLPPSWSQFDREWEKLVSLSAGVASAAFTHAWGRPAHFDSRIWLGPNEEAVIDYFRWRQADAARCALNGCCYWTLRGAGETARAATRRLERLSSDEKRDLLRTHGIAFDELPTWQRWGTGLRWREFEKLGRNPMTGEETIAVRRGIHRDEGLPPGDEYAAYLTALMDKE
jgi:tRNA(His) 5'-end guanylyltransferase/predicted kinase